MIDITLKAKHLRLIAYLLKEIVASDVFYILNEIKSKVAGDTDGDSDVIVTVHPSDMTRVYSIMSELPEGLAARTNKEMFDMLGPQFAAGMGSDNPEEWGTVVTFVTNWNTAMATRVQEYTDQGKQFLA